MHAEVADRPASVDRDQTAMAYKRTAKSGDKQAGKAWKIQGESSDGKIVTLGRYDTEESAKSDQARILEDGYYRKLKIVYTPPPSTPGAVAAAKVGDEEAVDDLPVDEDLAEVPETDVDSVD